MHEEFRWSATLEVGGEDVHLGAGLPEETFSNNFVGRMERCKLRALIVERPNAVTIREIPRPTIGPYHALARMELMAICNSTDTKIIAGDFPGFATYPATLGHEGIGTVVEIGERVTAYQIGDRVLNPCTPFTGIEGLASGWGTLAEYALVGDYAAMVADDCDAAHGFDGVFETQKTIPSDIPSRQAILLSTWREVYAAFADFGFVPGRSLLVIGGGPVGLSFVKLAKLYGMRPVCLATRSAWKQEKARALGADAVFPADKEFVTRAKDAFPEGFAYVIDAVGSPAVINQALQLVEYHGTVGVYGTVPEKQLTLGTAAAPYNWRLVMHQWPDYALEAAAHELLCEWLREGRLSSEAWITHELPFSRVAEGFELVKGHSALKVVVYPDDTAPK